MWVHNILAFSNVVGLFVVYYARHSQLCVGLVMFASTMMHLTETKHGLRPIWQELTRQSSFWLNVDRFVAVCVFLYLLPVWLVHKERMLVFVMFAIGAVYSYFGERTMNLAWYTVLHLAWHLLVYASLFVLMT